MAIKNDIKRQVSEIKRNAANTIRNKIPLNIEKALTGVGVVVANKAQEYTPIEYSNLINSQYHTVEQSTNGYRAVVVYVANYAAALHNRIDWSPRKPEFKAGPAWNPRATHHFLTRAAKEEQTTINRIMLGDLEL